MWLIQKSHHFFPLSYVFFSANDTALLKDNNQSDFKALLKLQIKLEENEGQLFQLCRNQLSIGAVKYLHRPKHPVFEWLNFFHFKMDVAIKW